MKFILLSTLVIVASRVHRGLAGETPVGMPCPDLPHCLRSTAVELLDTLGDRDLPLIGDSLTLVRDPQIEADPNASASKDLKTRFTEFLRTRRLLIKLPQLAVINEVNEGRKKDKGGYGAVAMMMGGALVAMGFSALAALAGKALAASMAALMMAAMAALKKHSGHSGYEVITVGGGGHHHRSLHLPQNLQQEEAQASYPDIPYQSYPRSND